MISKIKRVRLRNVWRHEAHDFTTWLESNIDVLNDILDPALVSAEREQTAGTFSVDLVAEDEGGQLVIIENQLEKSDHDHLGKLLTYLTSLEAKAAVWIVGEPRPEHVRAISWLNESSSASFYLVKLEAIQIADSPPAPLLTLITGPSREAVEAGEKKKEFAERYVVRKKFWTGLLEHAKSKTRLHSNISPGHYNWIGTSAGLPTGLNLNYSVRKHDGRVELYIDADRETGAGNTRVFDALFAHKAAIEVAFGEELEWEPLENKRACRIAKTVSAGGWQDEEKWSDAHAAMVDSMIRLNDALRDYLGDL